jgi:hypothetical protein
MLDHFVMQAIFAMGKASAGPECIAEFFDINNVAPQLKSFKEVLSILGVLNSSHPLSLPLMKGVCYHARER